MEKEKALEAAAFVWRKVFDPNKNRYYYYHRETRKTTWVKPEAVKALEEYRERTIGVADTSDTVVERKLTSQGSSRSDKSRDSGASASPSSSSSSHGRSSRHREVATPPPKKKEVKKPKEVEVSEESDSDSDDSFDEPPTFSAPSLPEELLVSIRESTPEKNLKKDASTGKLPELKTAPKQDVAAMAARRAEERKKKEAAALKEREAKRAEEVRKKREKEEMVEVARLARAQNDLLRAEVENVERAEKQKAKAGQSAVFVPPVFVGGPPPLMNDVPSLAGLDMPPPPDVIVRSQSLTLDGCTISEHAIAPPPLVDMPAPVDVVLPPMDIAPLPQGVGITPPLQGVGFAPPPMDVAPPLVETVPPPMDIAPPPQDGGFAPPPRMDMAPPPQDARFAPPPRMDMAPPPQDGGFAPPPRMDMAPPPQDGGFAPPPRMDMAPPPQEVIFSPAPPDSALIPTAFAFSAPSLDSLPPPPPAEVAADAEDDEAGEEELPPPPEVPKLVNPFDPRIEEARREKELLAKATAEVVDPNLKYPITSLSSLRFSMLNGEEVFLNTPVPYVQFTLSVTQSIPDFPDIIWRTTRRDSDYERVAEELNRRYSQKKKKYSIPARPYKIKAHSPKWQQTLLKWVQKVCSDKALDDDFEPLLHFLRPSGNEPEEDPIWKEFAVQARR